MDEHPLLQWVIYDHPSDFPNEFVARRWAVYPNNPEPVATDFMLKHVHLQPLRDIFSSMGLVCLARHESDDPVIVEMWM